jgi:hypothetical protein
MIDEHIEYLNELRESGIVNMVGATPHLCNAFPELSKGEARDVLLYWMQSFKRA